MPMNCRPHGMLKYRKRKLKDRLKDTKPGRKGKHCLTALWNPNTHKGAKDNTLAEIVCKGRQVLVLQKGPRHF